jgi:TP901 family phage tail tape measure protein
MPGTLNVGNLIVKLLGDTTQFKNQMDGVNKKLAQTGDKLRKAGGMMTRSLTLPLLGVGVAAGKMASDLSMTMSRVVGLVGLPREEVAKWREEILELAPAMGKSANELGEALFFITSAGIRGTKVMEAVKAAAMGASAGLGDTAVVADAATSAMNAYATANMTAEQATAILVATVREGKAEASSLAPVLGAVMPIAANLGVTFDQVGASMAAMTRLGLDASIAATALRATLSQIAKPAKGQIEALAGFNITFDQLRDTIRERGLIDGLMMLKDTFGENEEAMAKVFPNIRALTGVLAMLGENTESTRQIFKRMAKTTEEDLIKAFEAAEEQAGFRFQQALVELKNVLIRLGDIILPTIVPAIDKLAEKFAAASKWLAEADEGTKKWVLGLGALGLALGPVLMAFGFMAQGMGALITMVGSLAVALPSAIAGVQGFAAALTAATGSVALLAPALVALAAIVGVIIGTAIRPLVNELFGLNEAFGLIAHQASDVTDGMIETQEAWDGAFSSYEALRKSLKLSGKEWEVANDRTRTNAERLQALTDKAITLAKREREMGDVVDEVAKKKAEAISRDLAAKNQVEKALDDLTRKEQAALDALKEKYEVLSKDDIAQQMESIAADFHQLKDTVDKTQLAEKFNEPMLKLAKLADENKVAIPEPFKEAARHLDDKMIPGLDKLISRVHVFRNDFTQTGKIIDGIMWSTGERAEAVLTKGFGQGITKGVQEGERTLQDFVRRIENDVIYLPVMPDLEMWNRAMRDMMEGRVPNTTG